MTTATARESIPQVFPDQLGITVSEQGRTTTISLRGEWDLAQQAAMRAVFSDVLDRSPECVVLDLTGVSFIDSTGVHGVIELHKRSEQQRTRLVILPGPGAVQRIFEMTGLTEVLPFLTDTPGINAARPRSARPSAMGSGGALSPPTATPAVESLSGRRR